MSIKPLVLNVDDGSHRQANWLELFFDLAFVICVSTLSHQLVSSPRIESVLIYAGLFVPVWWVWNQFTWYASQFDNGDTIFRSFMIAAVGGTLLLVMGLHDFAHGHAELLIGAYVFVHVVLALGWLRVHREVALVRPYSRYKLVGILLGIAFWAVSFFFDSPVRPVLWAIGLGFQLALPIYAWAWVKSAISVHHGHITERHGLFTIIILGESLLSLVNGVEQAGLLLASVVALLCFAIVVTVWMTYFKWRFKAVSLASVPRVFAMNYGHLPLYAGLGVLASGIGLVLDPSSAEKTHFGLSLICVGAGVFLFSLTGMHWVSNSVAHKRFRVPMIISGLLLALGSAATVLPATVILALTAALLLIPLRASTE